MSDGKLANAPEPAVGGVVGSKMSCASEEQLPNALLPMLVTLSGIVTDASE